MKIQTRHKKLIATAVTVPGLLSIACEMNDDGTPTVGAGYGAETSSQTEHRYTYAWFLSTTAQQMSKAYNSYTECGGGSDYENDWWGLPPITTTAMSRSRTWNPWDYSWSSSEVHGSGGYAKAYWYD
jgi:hypothetical protein